MAPPVRVKDIGTAVDGPENAKLAGWQNGHRGIQLLIFKQPGANVIDTVNKIRAELPQLQAAIPPSIHVDTVIDRTLTIQASVKDVQFTLLLSIALVVMVIFLFLRNFWATVIPSVTVPLALVGTFAVMFLLGYSLDNLSLMALTIAVGFVVDDAIVMLENIYRYVEEGMNPMEAALRGAGEIGFTIISISVSLIAVFIPLLLMGGIVGRLFREFAMTVSIAVVVSGVISLTLTPMMCSRFLKHHSGEHGRLYRVVEGLFDGLIGFYERTLDIALRFRFVTLMVFFCTLGITGFLYVTIPKGFFPQQDTGVIIGITEGAQDISFAEMARRQQALGDIISTDPDVQAYSSSIGAGLGGQTGNNGRLYIALKPFDERTASAQQIIARLREKTRVVEGAQVFMQPAQDINVGGRLSRTQYQFTLQDADLSELYQWAPKILAKLRALPTLRDLATDQQMSGTTATLTIDRDAAARFGITPQQIDDTLYDAFGQRQITQYFTQINSYHLILEVPQDMQGNLDTLGKLYVKSAAGTAVPLNTFVKVDTNPVVSLSLSHQSQFPAVTLSFNLAPNAALGAGGERDPGRHERPGRARHAARDVPGHGAGLPILAQQPALPDRRRAHHGLHHPRHPLRELHPAAHHPVDAAVGRCGRADDADDRALRPVDHRADRRDPADRHREEERHHDGGLRHLGRAAGRRDPAERDPPGLPAAVPPHPDDHHGGDAGRAAADARQRRRIGTAQAAGVRHGRRPAAQPGADTLYDPGDLPLSGPAAALARPAPPQPHAGAGGKDGRRRGLRPKHRRPRLAPGPSHCRTVAPSDRRYHARLGTEAATQVTAAD